MSTRRARIKAVTALPPRRRNVDTVENKKNLTVKKEELESCIKDEANPSSEQVSKEHSEATAQEPVKDACEAKASPSKRRLSVNKTTAPELVKDGYEAKASPSKCRLSMDKTHKEGYEEGIKKTPIVRRLSIQKAPRNRPSVEKSPQIRRLSLDKTPNHTSIGNTLRTDKDSPKICNTSLVKTPIQISTEATIKTTPGNSSKTETLTESKRNENNVPTSNILKGLLAAPRAPLFNKPSFESKSIENRPSTSKDDGWDKIPNVPVFASPLARASPRRPSPIVRTPVIEVDLTAEKFIAPHKGPNSVKTSYIDKHGNIQRTSTNPDVEVIVERMVDKNEFQKLKEFASSSEAGIMDGIIPLQQVSKTPKPIDLLKNEIISENAEVFFDPIVPLPSPSKVRPKLRPMPRLGPRRNSFQQGSASESEDENRRLLGRPATPATPGPARQRHDSHSTTASMIPREVARVRNDSVCSTVSQAPTQAIVGSPLREREKTHNNKARREEMTARRNAALRKRQMDVKREKLTMYDLIFYNPKSNPIIPDQDEIKAKEANKKEDEERKAEANKQESKPDSKQEPETLTAVPQIKLGPDGELVIDEQSLVVNQSNQRTLETSIVREGAWGGAGSRAYRRTPKTADWSNAETVRFYRALAAMGTDFTLMQPLFPTRSRRDLKLKFKKEERCNLAQIDLALRSGSEWNPQRLETEFAEERQKAKEDEEKAKEQRLREKEERKELNKDMKLFGVRRSRFSKLMGESAMPKRIGGFKGPSTFDEYVKCQEDRTRSAKLKKEPRKRKAELPHATLTPIGHGSVAPRARTPSPSFATLTLLDKQLRPIAPKPLPKAPPKETPLQTVVPRNIEKGSLVVLTVNDPKSPTRKMLQTYIAQGPGNLTPVSLPSNFLNSVVGFMKNGSPKPALMSPSVTLERIKTTSVKSPRKRKSSYTITQL